MRRPRHALHTSGTGDLAESGMPYPLAIRVMRVSSRQLLE